MRRAACVQGRVRVASRRRRRGAQMKKAMCFGVLVLMALLFASPPPVDAHGHGGVFVGAHFYVRPGFWWPGPWWGPAWWGPPYPYSPPVVVQQPPGYVQPPPPPAEPQYWYYCQKPQ